MKKFKLLIVVFLLPSLLILGWGDKGHKLIAKHAMLLLPQQIKLNDEIKNAIIEHSIDPDYRKKQDPTEPHKHFIDIDYYKEFLNGHMIMSKDSLVKIYSDSIVERQGILPWATEDTYLKLVKAFKDKNENDLILYASDLAHYVGDGHQPLHACLNYNGQLTGQKGVHFRYEIEMFDKYLPEIENGLETKQPIYIKDPRHFIFNYITEANSYVDLLLSADKFAYNRAGQKYDDDYYYLLWFKTRYVTETEINEASYALSSLIYSAWIDAGKPDLNF